MTKQEFLTIVGKHDYKFIFRDGTREKIGVLIYTSCCNREIESIAMDEKISVQRWAYPDKIEYRIYCGPEWFDSVEGRAET